MTASIFVYWRFNYYLSGHWSEDKRHGPGEVTINGVTTKGQWVNGDIKTSITISPHAAPLKLITSFTSTKTAALFGAPEPGVYVERYSNGDAYTGVY